MLNRDLAERRGWVRSTDISEALAYTKPLPGSTVVQVVTYLGWRIGGLARRDRRHDHVPVPAFAIMTVAAAAVFALPDLPGRSGRAGWFAGRGGRIARRRDVASGPQRGRFRAAALVLLAAALAGLFVNAALIVLVAGLVGIGVRPGDAPCLN